MEIAVNLRSFDLCRLLARCCRCLVFTTTASWKIIIPFADPAAVGCSEVFGYDVQSYLVVRYDVIHNPVYSESKPIPLACHACNILANRSPVGTLSTVPEPRLRRCGIGCRKAVRGRTSARHHLRRRDRRPCSRELAFYVYHRTAHSVTCGPSLSHSTSCSGDRAAHPSGRLQMALQAPRHPVI